MTFIPADAQTSLVQTQQIFQNTFGSVVNLNPTSINGVFIQELANKNFETNSIQTLLYGGLYNPNVASGKYLDSICALFSLARIPAIASFATCQVTGLTGTVIPLGAQILNTNGDIFTLTSSPITITGNPSNDSGVFTSTVAGVATPVNAGTLNRIVQQLSGWDTVTNPTNGVLGKPAQTDTSLRYTRTQALAINSTGTIDAIISGAFLLIPNIISDFIVLQNPTNAPAVINGVTVPAYGIYLSVVQVGADNEISKLLFNKKPPGSVMGGTYIPPLYIDPIYNWNTFQAKWEQATIEDVVIEINITNINYPAGTAVAVKNAVLDAFNNGTAAYPPISMRSGVIYAWQFVSSIVLLGITTTTSITITTTTLNNPQATLILPANQAPQLQLNNILVTGIS
jgi:hypothetical protein